MANDTIAKGAFAITPGAGALAKKANGILVGGAGTLTVTCQDGSSVTITAVAGQKIDLVVTHVTAASATGLVGLIL